MNTERTRADPRGERSRRALIDAGVELLAEGGWPGLTTRAIARRAGLNHGLVHYYFGGLGNLRQAIATTVVERSLLSVVDELATASDWPTAAARFIARANDWSNSPESRQVAELIATALRDDDVRALTAAALHTARQKTTVWLNQLGVTEPDSLATVLVALLDGIVLHRLVDPELDLADAARAIARLQLRHDTPGPSDSDRPSGLS